MRTLGLLLITDVIGVIVANIILFVADFLEISKLVPKQLLARCLVLSVDDHVQDKSHKNDDESDGKMSWLVDDGSLTHTRAATD